MSELAINSGYKKPEDKDETIFDSETDRLDDSKAIPKLLANVILPRAVEMVYIK